MEVMKGPFGEELIFKNKGIKSFLLKKNHFFFIDSYFKKNPAFKKAENILFLKSGESLKTLKSLELHTNWLLKNKANKSSTIVAIGGGSVGDSIGFLASVYLRGVPLVQVPTTWLAAVDSSVGGKTALNFEAYKNQIGTVYAPQKVYFFSELIKTSSIKDSEGEILKTLLLNINKPWANKILNNWSKEKITIKDISYFVRYKKDTVKKDINDTSNIRAVLNLGHTVGHALELVEGLSHSDAVKKGLLFSLNWSVRKKLILESRAESFKEILSESLPEISEDKLRTLISKDKKTMSPGKVNFIFPTDKGPLVKEASISDLVREYKRQVQSGF